MILMVIPPMWGPLKKTKIGGQMFSALLNFYELYRWSINKGALCQEIHQYYGNGVLLAVLYTHL